MKNGGKTTEMKNIPVNSLSAELRIVNDSSVMMVVLLNIPKADKLKLQFMSN